MTQLTRSIAIAMGTLLTLPVLANPIDIYGKANLSVQSSDEGEGSFTEVKSNASRIGLKGSTKLSDTLTVVYKAEFQVDMADDEGDNIKARNQYVGLQGGFGEILVGRMDSALKVSQGKADIFSDYEADIKALFKGENRTSDSIYYTSPKFGEFQISATYIAEDSEDGEDGYSLAASYGDAELKKNKVYASVAMDKDVKGYDILRATIQGDVGGVILGGMYQTQESTSGSEADGFMVNAQYKIDKINLKAQYQIIELDNDANDKNSGLTLGADYKLGKNTKLFGFYTSLDFDAGKDKDYLAVGLEYKF